MPEAKPDCAPSNCSAEALPMPLGLAQRSAKCRLCGQSFFTDSLPKGWAYNFREILWPVNVILNFGEECAHAQCLNPPNAALSGAERKHDQP